MTKRPRLRTLEPRIKELPPRLKEAPSVRAPRKRANKTGRDADPRRTLPLTSAAWRKLRAYILNESPLCEHCAPLGLVVPATDVDHVDGNPGNNSMANLQSLCHACHSRKTAADHGKAVNLGSDVDGVPLDPNHPWRKSPAAEASRPTVPPVFIRNRKKTL